jgi:hypothetical protein
VVKSSVPAAAHTRSGRPQQRVGSGIGSNHSCGRGLGEPRQRRRGGAEQVVHALAVLLAPPALEQALVDPQRQRGIGVADVLLDVGGVAAGRQQQADVGAPQRVRRALNDLRHAPLAQERVASASVFARTRWRTLLANPGYHSAWAKRNRDRVRMRRKVRKGIA